MSFGYGTTAGSQSHLGGAMRDNLVTCLDTAHNFGAQPVGSTNFNLLAAVAVGMLLHVHKVQTLRFAKCFGWHGQHTLALLALKVNLCHAAGHNVAAVVKLKNHWYKIAIGGGRFAFRYKAASKCAEGNDLCRLLIC